jgi:hypothetical protein
LAVAEEGGVRVPPNDDQIQLAAQQFRAAIDAAGNEPWLRKDINFPRGACGHASELLGRYLINQLGIVADYVNKEAPYDIGGWNGSHAWLEWNGITIDIAGDQFGWPPVIVTRDPQFHVLGECEVRHPVCLPHQRDWWAIECGSLWNAIVPFLKAA